MYVWMDGWMDVWMYVCLKALSGWRKSGCVAI